MNFDAAKNLALAPHLYEPDAVRDAIDVFEKDIAIWVDDTARRPHRASHNRVQITRLRALVDTCKTALEG